jgi:hypothetical protein
MAFCLFDQANSLANILVSWINGTNNAGINICALENFSFHKQSLGKNSLIHLITAERAGAPFAMKQATHT